MARGQQTNYNNAGYDAGAVLGSGGNTATGNLLSSLAVSGQGELKATSASGLGKGLSKATSSGYASASKASSGTKGY